MRTLSFAALGTAAVVTGVAVVPDLLDDDGLPSNVSRDLRSYRIVYRTEAGDAVTTEVLSVIRPFESHLVVHRGDSTSGPVVSERASALGVLATRSQGARWTRLSVPPALASADLRPDASLADAVAAKLVEDLGPSSVGGRACRRYRAATSIAAGTLESPTGDEQAIACVDAAGLVLDEVWTIDGDVVRHRRAISLEADPELELEIPTGNAPPGSASFLEKLADDEPIPFGDVAALTALPEGFTHEGRYAVVPPNLSTEPTTPGQSQAPDLATFTDVWVRGSDVIILDQGASTRRDPFGATDISEPVELRFDVPIESAALIRDLRATELQIRLDDGGFVRLSATLSADDLLDLARSLTLEKGTIDE